jgi:hypothetical protein
MTSRIWTRTMAQDSSLSIEIRATPADIAHQIHSELVEAIINSKRSFVAMGQLLHELRENDNWRNAVGDGPETWSAYLAQPEIGLSKGEADRLIQIYENFVLWLGMSPDELEGIPIKNLHYLLPIAKESEDGDYVRALVEDAKVLSQRDFRERIHDVKSGENGIRTYEYIIMRKCVETGSLQKVHDISSDLIKETFNIE